MKVLLFERRFWEAVVCGHKVHSIRPTRKRPINVGDKLSLRGWEGVAYRSPQRILTEETCIAIREIWIGHDHIVLHGHEQFWDEDLDAFARSDGFANWEDMRAFRHFHYKLPFSGELIQWGVHPMLNGLGELRAKGR